MRRIKTVWLPKMSATALAALLGKTGCCEPARKWAKGRSLAEAWRDCEKGEWMQFLVWKMAQLTAADWPSRDEWSSLLDICRTETGTHSAAAWRKHVKVRP